jgi:hypothetical protein
MIASEPIWIATRDDAAFERTDADVTCDEGTVHDRAVHLIHRIGTPARAG